MYFPQNKNNCPSTYLFKVTQDTSYHYLTRSAEKISSYQFRSESFKSSFFPWIIVKWKKSESKIQNLSSSLLKNIWSRKLDHPQTQYSISITHRHYYTTIRKTVWRHKNKWWKFIKTPRLQNKIYNQFKKIWCFPNLMWDYVIGKFIYREWFDFYK